MAWVEQDLNLRLAGQPWTSAKAIADVENLDAVAAQEAGAPKIADKTVYDTGTNEVVVSDLDDFLGVWIKGEVSDSKSSTRNYSLEIAYSTDGGSTFSTEQSLISFTYVDIGANPEDIHVGIIFDLFIDFATGDFKIIGQSTGTRENNAPIRPVAGGNTGTLSGGSDAITDIKIIGDSAGVGNFDTFHLLSNPQGGESAS